MSTFIDTPLSRTMQRCRSHPFPQGRGGGKKTSISHRINFPKEHPNQNMRERKRKKRRHGRLSRHWLRGERRHQFPTEQIPQGTSKHKRGRKKTKKNETRTPVSALVETVHLRWEAWRMVFFSIAVTLAVLRTRQTGTSSAAPPGIPTASAELSRVECSIEAGSD